jgi:hypothetical protein
MCSIHLCSVKINWILSAYTHKHARKHAHTRARASYYLDRAIFKHKELFKIIAEIRYKILEKAVHWQMRNWINYFELFQIMEKM